MMIDIDIIVWHMNCKTHTVTVEIYFATLSPLDDLQMLPERRYPFLVHIFIADFHTLLLCRFLVFQFPLRI